MSQIVTIIGISGAQQSAIAARFVEAGWDVRGTSRKPTVILHGDIVPADPETGEGLAVAMAGADVAVLTLPQDHRPGAMPRIAASFAHAARESGVKRIILNTAATISNESSDALFVDMRAARDAVTSAGTPWVILQPTVYMDNLLEPWFLPAIVQQGILNYPAPETAPISWISHKSLGEFAYAAATHPTAVGHDLKIGGPEALTGLKLCQQLGQQLDRAISYQRIPLAAFAAGIDQAFGAPAGERIASLYASLDDQPQAIAVDGSAAALLKVKAESFATFAARQNWTFEESTVKAM